ncbi:MAG: TVP38/TMEM64 family protein [Desulfovibrio sp.]|nr:TVP38/TMEM64 family protein [Desulfovibrio sp.]MBI4960373.1 TVP38/TMEM64 family protein [Desulfovibrio sp.]
MSGKTIRKALVVAVVAAAVALFFVLDGPRYLNLESLKGSRNALQVLYSERPVLMLGGYFLFYIAATALNLPGAAVLSMAGSAVFGFWAGLVTVSFASSLGATLACALSRYVLRESVRSRFANVLGKIDAGLAKEGAWYLFSLRLVPVVPFFLINVCMGLTSMPLRTFYWVSQIGMLPGTAVFVNAGTELGRIDNVRDVLSLELLGSLALLAVFPWVARLALKLFRR